MISALGFPLPPDRPRKGDALHPVGRQQAPLSSDLIRELCAALAAGPDAVLRAALLALRNRYMMDDQLEVTFRELLAFPLPETGGNLLHMTVDEGYAAVEYAADLYEPETAERLLAQFGRLLEVALAAPDAPVSALPMVGDEAVLVGGSVLQPDGRCVHELIAAQPAERVAVRFRGGLMTFGELNRRANQLAHHLRRLGVRPDTVVGVCLDRSPELIIAMLGILKAGGAYLPLDPSFPSDRLAYIISQSGALAVVTPELLAAADGKGDGAEPEPVALPGNLAYVIYTSGSTGQPKGVEIEHGSLLNLTYWFRQELALSPADRVTFASGLSFDASVSEIWPCLTVGAALCLPDEEVRLSPERMRDWLIEAGVTVAFAATPLTHMLLDLPWPAEATLRHLYAGGDQLQRVPEAGLPFAVGNAYGPTECTCIATYAVVPPDPERKVTIGRPVANTRVLLLDQQMRPVPAGAPGELYVGGLGLARGYRNRADLTAERFVGKGASRLYRTGDLARLLPSGELDFLGRLDVQVKVRGFRIEPADIEAALLAHHAVREAAVTVWEDDRGEKRLAAYLCGTAIAAADLRVHLEQRLPGYMIPSAFTWLATLPLTPSGKIDRKALPPPDFTAEQVPYEAPRSPEEEVLAELWEDLLGVNRVGRNDGFFDLGGHSLLATQVVSRVRSLWGVDVPLREFFAAPTVAALGARVAQLRACAPAKSIQPAPRDGPIPLSFSQMRLVFLDMLAPCSPLYNVGQAIRLSGRLDPVALEAALNVVVQRHEALRTNFVDFRQVIHPHRWIRLQRMEAIPDREATHPFDLASEPLLRAALIPLEPEEYLLLLTFHHTIIDAWSIGIFYRELAAAYSGVPLPPVPLQYADFAIWQQEWLSDKNLAPQLQYWRNALADVPHVLDLPTDRPRPPIQSIAGARRTRVIPSPLMETLQSLSRQEGATLFMTLLATYQALLYRYTGQERFAVGVPIANRNWMEAESIIGFFVNTLPLPADLRGDPTFRELLARVRQTALDAFAHQDVPFEKLVEALEPERDPSRPPLIQTLFTLQNAPMEELQLPGITVTNPEPTGVDTGTAKYDLIVTVEEADGQFRAVAEYATALYDETTVDRLLGHFETLLAAAAAEPDVLVREIPVLTDAERQQILFDWNATGAPYVVDRSPAELIAAQNPAATAVVMGERQLTYRELNSRSDDLAALLAAAGVAPDVRAGVCLERSPDLPVALLAVWKAGGTYVAMDPAYPDERLNFMLADSGAPVVVTQRKLAPRFHDVAVVCVEDATGQRPAPRSIWSPDQLAYVIYTSGSTGRPKGVEITHRSLLNLICWHQRAYFVSTAARATQLAGPGFDASVWELWPYLTAGAQLLLPDEETRLSPPRLLQWLTENRVTITFLPTPLAEAMLALPWPADSALTFMLTGGDTLHLYPDQRHGFTLVNHYGPTESTVVTTAATVSVCPTTTAGGAPPIGRPIANTTVFVMDSHRQPVPVGVPGELYIGGDGLARGYSGAPELTAAHFLQTPFGLLYRTGDLVRWLPDGQLEYLGRTDYQVKIHGIRIELGEIESTLARYSDIADAVVVPLEQRLIAYIIVAPNCQPEPADLRARLASELPEYMVPTAIVFLEKFPLTPNGKVDRRALPRPDARASHSYEAPMTEVERVLAAIWAEVLGVEQVGLRDNFFELGGHSISAIQLVQRVRAKLGADLPLRTIFETPTVKELADRVTPVAHTDPPFDPATLDAETARHWLARLDELSDEEVETLFSRLAKEDLQR